MNKSKPNLLLITTDQQRADHLGLAGLKAVPTPHLDRLGREGLHLERAYTCCPVCTPARVSLLTGQYPSRHGAYTIGVTPEQFPKNTLPALLSHAGYRTALFGKSHFVEREKEWAHVCGTDNPNPDRFRTFTGPYLGFDEVALSTGHTINQIPGGHYRCFLEDSGKEYSAWFPQMHPGYNHDATGVWEIPVEFHDSTWVGNLTTDFISKQAQTEAPWFAWASFQDPHEPHVCPREWMDRVDPSAMELPEGYREAEFQDKPVFYHQAYAEGHFGDIDDEFGTPCASRRQVLTDKAAEAMHATLGMIAGIDEQVGRMLQTLAETGQLENTVIVFTSDHGEYHGHHGFWGKGLPAYEDAQRIPLLIWGPGHVHPTGTSQALASLIDLPATFLHLAHISPPMSLQGRSLTPLFETNSIPVREELLIELRAVEDFSQHTLITKTHKLVVYETLPEGELYELQHDPDQYRNLWNDPASQNLKMELLHRLARHYQENEGVHYPRTSFA